MKRFFLNPIHTAALAACLIPGAVAEEAAQTDEKSYIAEHTAEVPAAFRPALGDHLHCSVFRKFSKNKVDSEKAAAALGPGYGSILGVLESALPDYKIVSAHRCSHDGNRFVHITLVQDAAVMSMIISQKGAEEVSQSGMKPLLSAGGNHIYDAGVRKHRIAAFDTQGHRVSLVSDLSAKENADLLAKVAPGIRTLLVPLEQK